MLAGPDEAAFTVHENYICAKSKFFQAACRKEWSEGAKKLIRLPEVEPGMFSSYLNWVYTSNVVVEVEEDSRDPEARLAYEQDGLMRLYVLGDVLDDLPLRNQTLKDLANIVSQPSSQSVTWAYEHTPAISNLRQVLVHLAALKWDVTGFIIERANYHHEFVRDLAVVLMYMTKHRIAIATPISLAPQFLEDESSA